MITLTLPNGDPVAVNPRVIFYVTARGANTEVVSSGGAAIEVKETFAEIETRMKAWAKG